jgi:hypothetical protein
VLQFQVKPEMLEVGHLKGADFEQYHALCTGNFLPGGIVHRTTDRKRDRHSEIAQALQITETEYILELLNTLLINLVDNINDSGNAICRSKLNNRIVPLRILQQRLGRCTATNATRKDGVVSFHGESSVGSSK